MIGSRVGRGVEELFEQVAVGPVQFDTVEAGGACIGCGAGEVTSYATDLFCGQGARIADVDEAVGLGITEREGLTFMAGAAPALTGRCRPGWIEMCDNRPTCQSWAKIRPSSL